MENPCFPLEDIWLQGFLIRSVKVIVSAIFKVNLFMLLTCVFLGSHINSCFTWEPPGGGREPRFRGTVFAFLGLGPLRCLIECAFDFNEPCSS